MSYYFDLFGLGMLLPIWAWIVIVLIVRLDQQLL